MIRQYIKHFIGFVAVLLIIGIAAGWENGYWDKHMDKLAEPTVLITERPLVVAIAGSDAE